MKGDLLMSNAKRLPPIKTNGQRAACLELSNLLLGLSYEVIYEFRTRSPADGIKYVNLVRSALKDLYPIIEISVCRCGNCGDVCCACPQLPDIPEQNLTQPNNPEESLKQG